MHRPLACHTCRIIHRLPEGAREAVASAQGFADRHSGHEIRFVLTALEAREEQWRGNADVKLAIEGSEQAFTVTNLHSLASSPTAGWGSAGVDNSANLYLDVQVQVTLDPANTAPASSKAFFVYAFAGLNSSDYQTTGASSGGSPGSQGALTFPDITANPIPLPQIGRIPYLVADVVQKSVPMRLAAHFGGALPLFWGVAIVNHSGAALAASGNAVKYRGEFVTVT